MKILLIIGEHIFHYQKQVLVELSQLTQLEIYVLPCSEQAKIPNDSTCFKIINSKFPVFKDNPYSYENTVGFMDRCAEIEVYNEDFFYEYILNFCASHVIDDFKVKFRSILKPANEIKDWYAACINESDYTTINLLLSSDNRNFSPFKSLSFYTEMGMYNNRNKALYYFSYLVKSVLNGSPLTVKASGRKDYHFIETWTYHFKLLKIIFLRQFSKAQLNWKIAVLENNVPRIITEETGAFWADPFIVKERDKNWIFFEELDHQTRLGKISVLHLQENRAVKKEVVLEKPYHLSFPNVFKWEDNYYMLPEESESKEQNIYKAASFPLEWKKFKTIFRDTKIVDPVFIFSEGRYWLFFNKIEDFEYENNERLYLYSSLDLFSDQWESHPQNPVVIDKTKARNAGKIIKEGDRFLRVSQNCKHSYGTNISKNRITELTAHSYKEEGLPSNWDFNTFHGFHTINTEEDITVIDLLLKEEK